VPEIGKLKGMARDQLGTVGSGNHYVDLFEDEDGWVWIGVHFGSRGLGHKTATEFMLHQDSELGRKYLAGMTLAGAYAYAGREWVVERVRSIIGAMVTDCVHNHHNYAWRETHGGRELWVVRKGATPAFPGQRGFVGGSMGDDAVILSGVESAKSAESLYSTIHGAGRVMSRSQARGKRNRKTGEVITVGRISQEEMQAWLRARGVMLHGGDLDEAPQAAAASRGPRLPRGHREDRAHAAALCGRHGRRRCLRSLQGLSRRRPWGAHLHSAVIPALYPSARPC
jgi:tRNA-splicing ligase RtcB